MEAHAWSGGGLFDPDKECKASIQGQAGITESGRLFPSYNGPIRNREGVPGQDPETLEITTQ